jgi:hypothetical protein
MKLYFSTKSIPKLQALGLTARLKAIQKAEKRLTGPEKLLLNLLKLCIVVPIFIFIIQVSENWLAIIWALFITLLYPLLVKPIHLGLVEKYIPQVKHKGSE